MRDKEEEVFSRISDMICERMGVKRDCITTGSRLAEDFGMDGEDAAEFFERYFLEFEIDRRQFRYPDYFGPEAGCMPFSFMFSNKMRTIKVRHLVESARSRKWIK